jgi:hypothetical protein
MRKPWRFSSAIGQDATFVAAATTFPPPACRHPLSVCLPAAPSTIAKAQARLNLRCSSLRSFPPYLPAWRWCAPLCGICSSRSSWVGSLKPSTLARRAACAGGERPSACRCSCATPTRCTWRASHQHFGCRLPCWLSASTPTWRSWAALQASTSHGCGSSASTQLILANQRWRKC